MARRRDFDVRGTLALVTGGGGGIGRAICLALADEGARVLAVDIAGDAAEKTAAECSERGSEAHGLVCDVADAAAVQDLATRVHDTWGPLDILVNNAGVGMGGRWADLTLDDWNWIRGINLDGVVHGCMAFGPPMVERGRGHVVNLSSMLGLVPHAKAQAYCTTKAAVLMLSQCLRADWGLSGVGVTAVCPGGVNTSIMANGRTLGDGADEENLTKAFAKARPPEAVARQVLEAIRRNLPVVTVGWEAKAAWWSRRLVPLRLTQLMARVGVN